MGDRQHRPTRHHRRSRRRRVVGRAQRRRRRSRSRRRLGRRTCGGSRAATCCWPSMGRLSPSANQVFALQLNARAGDRHTYTLLRLGTREVARGSPSSRSRAAPAALYYVLAAVGIFTLLVGAAVRTRRPVRPGDAAFLLACGCVLRHVHVLVHRPLRSRRLVLLLGGRRGPAAWCRRSSCISRWSSRSARTLTATPRCWRDGCPRSTCRRRCSGLTRILALLRAGVDPDYFVRLIAAARHARARAP